MFVKPILFTVAIMLAIIGVVAIYALIAADLRALDEQQFRMYPAPKTFDKVPNNSEIFKGTQELKKFSSENEVKEFLKKAASLKPIRIQVERGAFTEENFNDLSFASGSGVSFGGARLQSEAVSWDSASKFSESDSSGVFPQPWDYPPPVLHSADGGDHSFSSTNIQVQGVDEPDHIKTDGKYIYVLDGLTLTIIDGYPGETAKITSKTKLDLPQKPHDMFLNKDKIVVFYFASESEKRVDELNTQVKGKNVTHATIIDISDRESPKVVQEYEWDGRINDSRMVGDYVYVVSNTEANHRDLFIPQITLQQNNSINVFKPNVFYFDNYEKRFNFVTITAINIFDGTLLNAKTYLMSESNTMYMSPESLYFTYVKKPLPSEYQQFIKDRFFSVIVPYLPESVREKIHQINDDATINSIKKQDLVHDLLNTAYGNLGYIDKKNLFELLGEKIAEFDAENRIANTIIHKIDVMQNNINYAAHGQVPGEPLNQFSMDEYDNSFRIATTYPHYQNNGRTVSQSGVYVMDDQLDRTGSLEGIAPNEEIFSARFAGDTAYLVTFEIVDPFFVIDLSGSNPKVLGELKLPGFSTYMHPLDENHVVGIGRDADDQGRQNPGVKLAIFDVTDKTEPTVLDQIIIGSETQGKSEALDNHKAFFLDAQRGVLSIPITERSDDSDRVTVFYVYNITTSDGFELNGVIDHDTHQHKGFRSFYIEDGLYTASTHFVKISDINNVNNEINSIHLK